MLKPRKILIPAAALAALALALPLSSLQAQEGHPLTGSWSGNRLLDSGSSRILLVLDLQPDQVVSGYILEMGKRLEIPNVTLDPSNWTLRFQTESADGAGYTVEAAIEDLSSARDRNLVGTWQTEGQGGAFHVAMN